MVDVGWLKMTAGLLLLAGSVGHVMQNGSAMAERWLGIEIAATPPLVAEREPRLIGYGGRLDTGVQVRPLDDVHRMDQPPPLVSGRQPGLASLDAVGVTTVD
ncbi:MAG: hypothetical protein MUF73_12045 [Rhodobacteraceae bacterium]|jgi:hypothetical protein|nr:hypothetical protein [Paracoccaceae bacterium]